MRIVVVGLGVQGKKRRRVAGGDFVASIDPVNLEADYRLIDAVPINLYDAALVCCPDQEKLKIIKYLVAHGKHVLVEKPLVADLTEDIRALEAAANERSVYLYTAYNHRFEPHFSATKAILNGKSLGKVYRCRMFYGNGTGRLVRDSAWRDRGSGVLADLGSHLLDTVRFWFDQNCEDIQVSSANCFENKAPDHVVLFAEAGPVKIELEMTLLMWRNHFTCDIFAENGTLHITSLCKWGPSSLIVRERVLPSGRPPEQITTLIQDDPTWQLEYDHFKSNCLSGARTNLSTDVWICDTLNKLSRDVTKVIQK